MGKKHAAPATICVGGFVSLAMATLSAGCASLVAETATPESMGVSTAHFRSYNCDFLADLLPRTEAKQWDQSLQPAVRKAMGWNADAIRQVQREKGCGAPGSSAGSAVATANDRPIYYYCYATDTTARKTVSSLVFQRGVFGDLNSEVNLTQALQFEFKRDVLARHGILEDALCVAEDARDKAQRSRDKHRSDFSGMTLTYIDVPWNPQAQQVITAYAGQPNSVQPPSQGSIGVRLGTMTEAVAQGMGLPRLQGVLIVETIKGRAAERAGLRPMDVVLEYAGQAVSQPADLQQMIIRTRPGFKAPIHIWRDRAAHDLVVEVEALPPNVQAR